MKRNSFTIVVLVGQLLPLFIFAQQKTNNLISADYDRNSICLVMLNRSNARVPDAMRSLINQVDISDKYFQNKLSDPMISVNFNRPLLKIYKDANGYNKTSLDLEKDTLIKYQNLIKNHLERTNFGNKILDIWSTSENNEFKVLRQRALYNVGPDDARRNQNPLLIQNVKNLFLRNYIIVFDVDRLDDVYSVKKSRGIEPSKDEAGYGAVVTAMVYKIEIDDKLFEEHIKPNFDNKSKLLSYNYRLRPIQYRNGLYYGTYTRSKDTPPPSDHSLYTKILQSAFDDINFTLEKLIDDFKVKGGIVSTHPLKIEIGRRENVKAEDRYFVYQNQSTSKGNASKRKATIRAIPPIAENTSGLKNTSGQFLSTRFKQTSGGSIREGMYFVQARDNGMGVSLGEIMRETNPVFYGRFDLRIGSSWKGKNFGYYVYLDYMFEDTVNVEYVKKEFNHVGLGIGKRSYLTKFFDFEPVLGVNLCYDQQKSFFYVNGGLRIPITLAYNFFLVPEIGYRQNITDLIVKEANRGKDPFIPNPNLLTPNTITKISLRYEF